MRAKRKRLTLIDDDDDDDIVGTAAARGGEQHDDEEEDDDGSGSDSSDSGSASEGEAAKRAAAPDSSALGAAKELGFTCGATRQSIEALMAVLKGAGYTSDPANVTAALHAFREGDASLRVTSQARRLPLNCGKDTVSPCGLKLGQTCAALASTASPRAPPHKTSP